MLSKSVIKRLWAQAGNKPEDFALAVEKLVREKCAVICDEQGGWPAYEVAEAIRARGNE